MGTKKLFKRPKYRRLVPRTSQCFEQRAVTVKGFATAHLQPEQCRPLFFEMSSNLGNIYRSKHWAKRWARGRPIHKVPGGWMICRYSKKRRRKVSRPTIHPKKSRKRSRQEEIKPILTIEF